MPRSSFSHNPLLRVSRPVSACSRCRAAKVKCDGKLPACTACEKAGREAECSAGNDQFARGKERSYVAALELRVEKLERRLQYAKSRKASVTFYDPDVLALAQDERRDSLAKIRAAVHRKAARSRENADVNTLVSDFGYLSVHATMRDFEPSASNMTFARLVLAASTNCPLPESSHPGLPPRQRTLALVQHYMTNLYPLFPCFQETALFTIIDDIYQERIARDSEYWMLYLVLAMGSMVQSKKLDDDHYVEGVELASKALEFADQALEPGHIMHIQSLLLLSQYSLLDPAHFHSWYLIGFTTRSIVDLGLHQDPPLTAITDKLMLERRRRMFYCAYALDRTISMVHARPFSFIDDAINVAFPKQLDLVRKAPLTDAINGPQSVDPALLLFQLRRAQSFWYQELYHSDTTPLSEPASYVWQMCLEMRDWGMSLPSGLSKDIRQMFEQELRYSYVYCISPSARAPQISDYHRILIFEYVLLYLDEMHALAQHGINSALYSYHDCLKIYFMANQLLTILRDAESVLLNGSPVVMPTARPGRPPPPPIPRRSVENGASNITRSLHALTSVPHTLAKFSERWDEATMLKISFERMSEHMIDKLRAQERVTDYNAVPRDFQYPIVAEPGTANTMNQFAAPPTQEMRWVGVDPSQMGRGSGL